MRVTTTCRENVNFHGKVIQLVMTVKLHTLCCRQCASLSVFGLEEGRWKLTQLSLQSTCTCNVVKESNCTCLQLTSAKCNIHVMQNAEVLRNQPATARVL